MKKKIHLLRESQESISIEDYLCRALDVIDRPTSPYDPRIEVFRSNELSYIWVFTSSLDSFENSTLFRAPKGGHLFPFSRVASNPKIIEIVDDLRYAYNNSSLEFSFARIPNRFYDPTTHWPNPDQWGGIPSGIGPPKKIINIYLAVKSSEEIGGLFEGIIKKYDISTVPGKLDLQL